VESRQPPRLAARVGSLNRRFFGSPWSSGVCEDAEQVPAPLGETCAYCREPVVEGDQGSFLVAESHWAPVHRECSLRSVMGGIGHLENHHFWCLGQHDPDGGRSYRESARQVWKRLTTLGG
jgi:hypothetical protein